MPKSTAAAGIACMVLGVWVVSQVWWGAALERLGL